MRSKSGIKASLKKFFNRFKRRPKEASFSKSYIDSQIGLVSASELARVHSPSPPLRVYNINREGQLRTIGGPLHPPIPGSLPCSLTSSGPSPSPSSSPPTPSYPEFTHLATADSETPPTSGLNISEALWDTPLCCMMVENERLAYTPQGENLCFVPKQTRKLTPLDPMRAITSSDPQPSNHYFKDFDSGRLLLSLPLTIRGLPAPTIHNTRLTVPRFDQPTTPLLTPPVPLPILPPEIQLAILHFIDPITLWFHLRPISHSFQQWSEEIVESKLGPTLRCTYNFTCPCFLCARHNEEQARDPEYERRVERRKGWVPREMWDRILMRWEYGEGASGGESWRGREEFGDLRKRSDKKHWIMFDGWEEAQVEVWEFLELDEVEEEVSKDVVAWRLRYRELLVALLKQARRAEERKRREREEEEERKTIDQLKEQHQGRVYRLMAVLDAIAGKCQAKMAKAIERKQ